MLFNHKPLKREVYSVIYLWFSFGGSHCQLLKTDCRLSARVFELCQSFDAGWRLSAVGVYFVSYLRQDGGYLLGCTLSVT